MNEKVAKRKDCCYCGCHHLVPFHHHNILHGQYFQPGTWEDAAPNTTPHIHVSALVLLAVQDHYHYHHCNNNYWNCRVYNAVAIEPTPLAITKYPIIDVPRVSYSVVVPHSGIVAVIEVV